MTTILQIRGGLIVVLIAGIIGCSEDNTSTGTDFTSDFPVFSFKEVEVPPKMASSADSVAQTVMSYIEEVNAVSELKNYLIPPIGSQLSRRTAGHQSGPPWRFGWQDDDLWIELTIDEDGELYVGDYYVWDVVASGQFEGLSATDRPLLFASKPVDASHGSGRVEFYGFGDIPGEFEMWSWTEISRGQFRFENLYTVDLGVSIDTRISINSDSSGLLQHLFSGEGPADGNRLLAEWTENGTGTWQHFLNASLLDSGSW